MGWVRLGLVAAAVIGGTSIEWTWGAADVSGNRGGGGSACVVGGSDYPSCAGAKRCGFYVAASGGSDRSTGTSRQPFATIAHAQSVIENAAAGSKVLCFKAGIYNLTVPINLSSADDDTVWQFDPASGANTAILDGGSTSQSTGLVAMVTATGSGHAGAFGNPTGITFNGLKFQNPRDLAFKLNVNDSTFENMDIGTNHDNSEMGGFTPIVAISGTNNTIDQNYVHDTLSQGIASYAFDSDETIHGTVITRNVVLRAVQQANDGGAIYLNMRNSVPNGVMSRVTISNNFVRDYGNFRVQAEGIYLDDDSSNVTVTGNIVGPPNPTLGSGVINLLSLNGGYNNSVTNNILDLLRKDVAVNAEGPCGTGGTVSCSAPSAPNVIRNNIILSNFAGGSAITNFDCKGCEYDQNPASSMDWISISGNWYYNYGRGVEIANGNIVSDSRATHLNPGCSGYLYNLSSIPDGFIDVTAARSAGPLGQPTAFDIPMSTNRSCP